MPVDNLIFYGTWNDGSSTGSLDFSNVLLSAGDVCEQFFYPATTRGWNSTVPFGLDICSTAGTLWRQLLGNRSNQTYLAGTWKYSHVWDGTAYTLFTGYLPSAAGAEDVLRIHVHLHEPGLVVSGREPHLLLGAQHPAILRKGGAEIPELVPHGNPHFHREVHLFPFH